MFLPLFHGSVVVLNCYTVWYDQQYLDMPFPAKGYEELPFKGRFMFLTMWCLTLQTLFFTVSLLNDIFGTHEAVPSKTPLIRKLKDCIFSIAFPTAIYVVACFWAVYKFDKELMFPDYIEAIVPFWANAVMHIFVAVFVVAELVFTRISYPSRKVGLGLLLVFNFSYLTWMHILHQRTGIWAYPLFDQMNTPTRIVFLGISTILGASLYVLGEKMAVPKKTSQVNGFYKNK